MMTDQIELVAQKDHPLGGFRLWKRGNEFAAEAMCDLEALSKEDPWGDVKQWVRDLPDPSTLTFKPAEAIYPFHYRMSEDSHAHWNICNFLQDYLPCNA